MIVDEDMGKIIPLKETLVLKIAKREIYVVVLVYVHEILTKDHVRSKNFHSELHRR